MYAWLWGSSSRFSYEIGWLTNTHYACYIMPWCFHFRHRSRMIQKWDKIYPWHYFLLIVLDKVIKVSGIWLGRIQTSIFLFWSQFIWPLITKLSATQLWKRANEDCRHCESVVSLDTMCNGLDKEEILFRYLAHPAGNYEIQQEQSETLSCRVFDTSGANQKN